MPTNNIRPLFNLLANVLLHNLNTRTSLYFSNTLLATSRLTRSSLRYYAHTVRLYTKHFRRHRLGVTRIGPPLSRPFVAGPYYFRLGRRFLFIYLFVFDRRPTSPPPPLVLLIIRAPVSVTPRPVRFAIAVSRDTETPTRSYTIFVVTVHTIRFTDATRRPLPPLPTSLNVFVQRHSAT